RCCSRSSARRSASLSRVFFFVLKAPVRAPRFLLSLHDALPICAFAELNRLPLRKGLPDQSALRRRPPVGRWREAALKQLVHEYRSEEHTSELQSPDHLVCRLLLEKKNESNRNLTYAYEDKQ